jgi:hypothetical protein
LEATFSEPLLELPDKLTVPRNALLPLKFNANDPVGVLIVPVLVMKFHAIVLVPVPPVFCSVPALMKVFVPD